jgi:hypothetical protein
MDRQCHGGEGSRGDPTREGGWAIGQPRPERASLDAQPIAWLSRAERWTCVSTVVAVPHGTPIDDRSRHVAADDGLRAG